MHDRADLLLGEDALDQRAIGDRAFEERHVLRDHVARPVRQIVDDRDAPPGVLQGEDGMTADIAGAAGDEDWKLGIDGGLAEDHPRASPAPANLRPRIFGYQARLNPPKFQEGSMGITISSRSTQATSASSPRTAIASTWRSSRTICPTSTSGSISASPAPPDER